MKALPIVFAVVMALVPSVRSQDAPVTTRITGPVPDGTPPAPAPKPVVPAFRVKDTVIQRFDVVEAPPMPGLPPVTGTITAKVRLVESPNLPELVLPAVPVARTMDPATLALFRERAARYVRPQFASLSVTVYDHKRSLLEWSFYGDARSDENELRRYRAWSNVDFSHFSNFASYQVANPDGTVRKYELMMFLMNYDSTRERWRSGHLGVPYQAPEIPVLPDLAIVGPTFVVMDGDDAEPTALDFIRGLHELYQIEGGRMELAYQARVKAEAERRAYLLANPPKPRNLVLHYWRGKRNASQGEGAPR